jgi:protein-arginine kinase activator protein McsA
MSCGVEMGRCEECGREVPRFELTLGTNGQGERALLCEQCSKLATESTPQQDAPKQ